MVSQYTGLNRQLVTLLRPYYLTGFYNTAEFHNTLKS